MLVTPLSPVVQHRLARCGGLPLQTALRLSQLRSSTTELLPELDRNAEPSVVGQCPACGDSLSPHEALRCAADAARRLRPSPQTAIDQCHTDVESLCRRLSAMQTRRPMATSRVAFVGDDDLASAGLLRTAPPASLLLLDIDERITRAVDAEALRLGLRNSVRTERVDLSAVADLGSVCRRYRERFDLVVTDPPYAQDGMSLFVRTAMTLTAYTGELHVAVPALVAEAWSDELLYDVQSMLLQAGFVIDQVKPGAFTYETSDVVSSLVIARRLPGTRPLDEAPLVNTDRFYTTRVVPEREPLLHDAPGRDTP